MRLTPGERNVLDLILEAMEEELTPDQVNRVLGRFTLLCGIGVKDCCLEDRQGWQN